MAKRAYQSRRHSRASRPPVWHPILTKSPLVTVWCAAGCSSRWFSISRRRTPAAASPAVLQHAERASQSICVQAAAWHRDTLVYLAGSCWLPINLVSLHQHWSIDLLEMLPTTLVPWPGLFLDSVKGFLFADVSVPHGTFQCTIWNCSCLIAYILFQRFQIAKKNSSIIPWYIWW